MSTKSIFVGISQFQLKGENLRTNSARFGIDKIGQFSLECGLFIRERISAFAKDDRGDVPGWVLIVLMTTGLVTGIWAIAKPNLTNILQNSLNSMNGIR